MSRPIVKTPGMWLHDSQPPASRELLERGKGQYAGFVPGLHGADARGGQLGGPNLLRSQLVLDDESPHAA